MKLNTIILPLTILVGLIFITSCTAENNDEDIIDGGNTYHIDENAAKVINSKNIKEFYLNAYFGTRFDINDNHFFEFEIKDNELKENKTSQKTTINNQLLISLQEIVDKYNLVSNNGLYDVTSGLPPEYAPSTLEIIYDSNEVLTYTIDNNPYLKCNEDIYDLFAKQFEENNNLSFYPDESLLINDINFDYIDNDLYQSYMTDDNTIERIINDKEEHIDIPDDYYEKVSEIIRKYHLIRKYEYSIYSHETNSYSNHHEGYYGMGQHKENEIDLENNILEIFITFENDNTISISTRKESEINGFKELFNELKEYNDSLFE